MYSGWPVSYLWSSSCRMYKLMLDFLSTSKCPVIM